MSGDGVPIMLPDDFVQGGPHSMKVTTTHKQRSGWLSEQIRKVNPISQREEFETIFSIYLICLDFDEAQKRESGA